MTTPVKFWRVSWSSNATEGIYTLALRKIIPRDGNTNNLLTGLTLSMPVGGMVGFPVENVIDLEANGVATYGGCDYPATNKQSDLRYVQFTYAVDVLWANVLLQVVNSPLITDVSAIPAESLNIYIDSSADNVTYTRQSMWSVPLSNNVAISLPATTKSNSFPTPRREIVSGAGGIYGIVSEDGVAQANRPVLLIERENFSKVGYTTTDENGGYAFNSLNENMDFMVMSYDPSGPPYKNALVWDRIRPINTRGNLKPANAFWARRARDLKLGQVVSYTNYFQGFSAQFFQAGPMGGDGALIGNTSWAGWGWWPETAAGGALRLLKSNRQNSGAPVSRGLFVRGKNAFTGIDAPNTPANYAALTFETVIRTPTPGEASLAVTWTTISDSNRSAEYDYYDYQGYWGAPRGPTVVASTDSVDFRMALGGNNTGALRATTPTIAGTVYHVMVTYSMDGEIKLYLDGVLKQTSPIVGTGRMWHCSCWPQSDWFNWDSGHPSGQPAVHIFGPAKRINGLIVAGNGVVTTNDQYNLHQPAFGGGFGMAAVYGRTFSASDVTSFYDSYANPGTHSVPTSYSGYVAEVEADSPRFYVRLNGLTIEAPRPILGHKDTVVKWSDTPYINNPGFVAGTTSTRMNNGVLLVECEWLLQGTFSFESFFRLFSLQSSCHPWVARGVTPSAPVYMGIANGSVYLSIYDHTSNITQFSFPGFTMAANVDYHIVITYDPWTEKATRLIVNGVEICSIPTTVIPYTWYQPLHRAGQFNWLSIGGNAADVSFDPPINSQVDGCMGEVAFYGYALPTDRALAHYNARNS